LPIKTVVHQLRSN